MKAILAILGIVLAVIGCLVVPTFTHGIGTVGAIIGILCLWGLGFKNIKIAHLGQPILFGVRLRWYFGEGWCWLFPLIMNVEEIDSRIGKKTFKTPHVFSKDNIRVSFTVAYWFRADKPHDFLGTKVEEIFEGVEDVIERKTRLFVKDRSGKECRQASEELVQELAEEVQEACKEWGIKITKLVITDVNYTTDYEEAIETEQSKKNKVKGDAAEMKNLRERVKKTQEELGLSAEKALEADQLQTRTIQKQINKIDIGENLKEALEKGFEKAGEGLGRVASEIVAGKMKKFGGKK